MVRRIGTSHPEVTPLYSNRYCPQAPDSPQSAPPRIVIRTPTCVPIVFRSMLRSPFFCFPCIFIRLYFYFSLVYPPEEVHGISVTWISSPSSTTLNRMVLGILLPNTKFPRLYTMGFPL